MEWEILNDFVTPTLVPLKNLNFLLILIYIYIFFDCKEEFSFKHPTFDWQSLREINKK